MRNSEPMRVVILGNAGSGKTTLARRLIGDRDVALLPLDDIAWNPGPERKPPAESVAAVSQFIDAHEEWIIEGCYGDLVQAALPRCTELLFLNPGVEACIAQCQARPWEPGKFDAPAAQQAMLDVLLPWVREYTARSDEFGLDRHRAIFDAFEGTKREYTAAADYAP